MLGICAGAQMIGSVLGKVEKFNLFKEASSSVKHKPTEKGEVCLHKLKLLRKLRYMKFWEFLLKMKL